MISAWLVGRIGRKSSLAFAVLREVVVLLIFGCAPRCDTTRRWIATVGVKAVRPSTQGRARRLRRQASNRDDLQFTYKKITQRPNFTRES